MNFRLRILKEQGHELLAEYASLDRRRKGKKAITHAYNKLQERLAGKQSNHFRYMHTEKEVLTAITKLRSMIARREKKNQRLDAGEIAYHKGILHPVKKSQQKKFKAQYAPNLMELQRSAGKGFPPIEKETFWTKIKKFLWN